MRAERNLVKSKYIKKDPNSYILNDILIVARSQNELDKMPQ